MPLMLSGLQAILIILVILLIITQTVSIRIRYDKILIFDFDLTLLSFTLIPEKKKERSKSKKGNPGILSIIKIIDYALAKSHFEIISIPRLTPDRENPLAYGYAELLRYIILAHFDKKTKSLTYYQAECSAYPLDVTFKISFYHFVCTLVLYFRECHKSRKKAGTRS